MMRNSWKYIVCMLLFLTALSCRKLYSPKVVAIDTNILVVEGVIDPGIDSTFIILSHTVNVADTVKTAAERGATVTVEGGASPRALGEIRPGVYSALPLNLDTAKQYHLRIRLANGKEYVSNDEKAKLTPPIDTITYTKKDSSLLINASAHDPSNRTHYYRWDYTEAWRFHAKYYSSFKVVNGVIYPRLTSEDIYSCFAGHVSSTILTASTVRLNKDVIAEAPIVSIPSGSEKISIRYSILIKQYALTKEGFEFYENLKKNTEKLGSIFDALPSEIRGNVHSTANAAEPVLGYVGVNTVQQKRVYINKEELPVNWITRYPYDCTQDRALFWNDDTHLNEVAGFILSGLSLPTQTLRNPGPDTTLIGYYKTAFICGDCTLRGTKKQPAFWKDK